MMNFNIHLFADAQTNTTGTMSVEMKTFYEKRLIDQAEPRLVHDQFADYYPVPQNGGLLPYRQQPFSEQPYRYSC